MGLTLLCLLCPSLILNSGICLPLKTFKKKDLCVWLFCVHGCLGTFCLPVALRSPNGEVRRGHWNLRTGVPGDCEPPLGYGNLIWVLWKSGQLNLIRPQQLSHHFSPSSPLPPNTDLLLLFLVMCLWGYMCICTGSLGATSVGSISYWIPWNCS